MDIIDKVPTVKRLMRQLQLVPFLASKNMYRVTSYFLQMEPQKAESFCKTLQDVKEKVVCCKECFVWKEKDQDCMFCQDDARDKQTICVVESWQDLLMIERTESYHGLYHILGGVICPLEGIGPAELTIDTLVKRAANETKEIIFAVNHTPEGEATIAFIAKKLHGTAVSISCLAKGVPIGSNLEFIDKLTIGKALTDRKPF